MVVFVTAVMRKSSGISGKLVVVMDTVAAEDVPELLVADNVAVYAVPEDNPYMVIGDPPVDISVMVVPPPVGVICSV